MKPPPRLPGSSATETARLAALRSFDVLDTPPEQVFDDLARLAAAIIGTPVALVSLVDGSRQWFKSRVGLDATETPRDVAFCAHAIADIDVFVVPDALEDTRFASNPLVTEGPKIRFYAGAPLLTDDGHALGTLCVIDFVPRELTLEQQEALKLLSQHVMAQLELRRRLAEINQEAMRRAAALQPVQQALERGEFVLYYQPQFDSAGNLSGLEALARWQHPERGLLGPAEFLPQMEASGLIAEFGRWVLQQAGDDYHRWLDAGLGCPPIAVNVSPVQLKDPRFMQDVAAALAPRRGVAARIDIEITEDVLLTPSEDIAELLQRLRQLGVRVAIDDFGAGYSSLRYLAKLPIDMLKLDRCFVQAMWDSPNDMAVASAVIGLARSLKLEVVAEGVETAEQARLLGLMRCDYVQGWLYGRPMAPEAVASLLERLCWTGAGAPLPQVAGAAR